jgi:hypothetical protein
MSAASENVRQLYPINTKPIKEFLKFIGDEDGLGTYTFRIGDIDVTGALDEHVSKLAAENRKGHDIGVKARHKPVVKSTMRSLDGCKVIAQQIGLKPACINQVSPKDYDIFFNVEAGAIADDDAKFDLLQKLANEYGGVRNIDEFVQVPGFWNLKDADNPFKMKRVYEDADAPTYTAAELDGLLTKLKGPFKEAASEKFNLPLPALTQLSAAEKPKSIEQTCKHWVWVTGMERFINRLDPSQTWRVAQFDSRFNQFLGKAGSISKELFREGALLRQYDSLCFTPGTGEFDGRNYNIWRPGPIKAVEGDTTLWDQHLAYLFPDPAERDVVLNWMAWVVQNPAKKPHYALLVIGQKTGTGKSFLARVMEQIIGENNTKRPKSSSIGGDFNSWVKDCKLAIVEEILVLKNIQAMNALRDTITEPRIEVNIKMIPQFIIKTYLALIAISNSHKALPLLKNDRRWLVMETKAEPRDKPYYKRLFPATLPEDGEELTPTQIKTLGAIYHSLLARDLSQYDARGRAPETEARAAMIEASANEWATHLLSIRDEWPLGKTRVVDPSTIVGVLPHRLQTAAAGNKVRDFLRDYMGGQPWETPIRPTGRKGKARRVWVLGSKDTARKLTSTDVLRMFRADDKGRADQVDRGTYIFEEDDTEIEAGPPTSPPDTSSVDRDRLLDEEDNTKTEE